MGKKQKIINIHILAKVLKFCHTKKTKANYVEMSDVKVVLADIANSPKYLQHE
jgi:hypothetical protein